MANSLLHINRGVTLSTDRERERGGHEERARGGHEETERGILPVRSVDQRFEGWPRREREGGHEERARGGHEEREGWPRRDVEGYTAR